MLIGGAMQNIKEKKLDREKPNPPSTPEPSVGDDAGGSGGSGGFGLLGALGSGLSITKLITTFKNIFRVIGKFTIFGTIIFAIIDFITGFIDKFEAADSLGEGILEGLWGGYTNVIRGIIYIPLDMLKDLLSWIAEKLGFSEVAKLLDSFSFVDLYDKATEWLYNTETDTWFGGALDDLPEKMKALYTDLKTKLESFIKDYIL
jgi:hypothetical protein